MLRFMLTVAVLLGSLSAAQAQLAIQNIQACYGPLGPERPNLQYHHLDHVSFRFSVTGARVDEEGIAKVRIITKMTAANDVSVGNSERTCAALLQFGPSFTEAVCFTLPQQLLPGEYTLTVAVQDDRCKEDVISFQRKLIMLQDEFAICSPEFYYDGEGRVEAAFGGTVGQKLHFQFNVIGIDCSTSETQLETRFEVFDAKTRQPLSKPVVKLDKTSSPVPAQPSVRLSSMIPLDRAGDFILRVIATDRIANKSANVEVPIHVSAP